LLLQASRATAAVRRQRNHVLRDSIEDWAQRLEKAKQLASRGELSSASRLLRSNGLAPGNEETLHQLTDPNLRPPSRILDFPAEVLNYQPDEAVQLSKPIFISNLRSARRGSSGSLSGHRNEHLKCCLDDEGALGDLCNIAQSLTENDVPVEIQEAYRLCKLTALKKNATKVRGLNAGDPFRRLVARTLAQQFASEFRQATSPYNF